MPGRDMSPWASIGGKARAAKLSPERRVAIAKKAIATRYGYIYDEDASPDERRRAVRAMVGAKLNRAFHTNNEEALYRAAQVLAVWERLADQAPKQEMQAAVEIDQQGEAALTKYQQAKAQNQDETVVEINANPKTTT